MSTPAAARRILTAEILSIGSELTVGETRDTNAGELARSLTLQGVVVGRLNAVPDRLEVVTEALVAALHRADLVVTTGGLGPTPDDLTRESIAAAWGEAPAVDPDLEAWLRGRWDRLGLPFPEINLKQAWLIPSAVVLPNPNGSAPGWFATRQDGGVAIALPGPPREMRPMWADHALPLLVARGIGADAAVQTYRLWGIGESQVAEILGEELLRARNPEVATYARVEAVDVRVSAVGRTDPAGLDATAAALVEAAAAIVRDRLGEYIWATGDTTWAGAIGGRLVELGWRVALVEIGTGNQVGSLFGDVDWLALSEARPDMTGGSGAVGNDGDRDGMYGQARRIRDAAGADVGLAVRAHERRGEMAVTVAIVTPRREHRETRAAFVGGSIGRTRAGLIAAAALFRTLHDD